LVEIKEESIKKEFKKKRREKFTLAAVGNASL
jgi:hypothetical protein